MTHQRLDGLGEAIVAELAAKEHRRALASRVLEAKLKGVHADLARQDIEHTLDREGGDGRARGAIGGDLRAIGHHLVADGARVRQVIGRERAHADVHHRRARESAGLDLEERVGGNDAAVAGNADLHRHGGARGRPGGLEDILAAHHHLDGMAGLAGQHQGDWLDIDHGLAAEAAADFGRIDPQVAKVHAEELRGIGAHHEMPLAGAPQLGLAVGIEARDAGLRLDIGLVHRRRLERHLDHFVGRGEVGIGIADLVLGALGDVGGLRRRRLDAAGDQVVEEERRIRAHRRLNVDDVRQHLVVDLDERQRLLGDGPTGGRDGRDRVALVEHLLAGHDVAGHVPEVLRHPLRPDIGEFLLREVDGGHHRLDAGQRRGLRDIDGANAGMGVRRAQDAPGQHAGHGQIGAVLRPPRHLRDAIRPYRAGSDPLELGRGFVHGRSR